MNAHPKYCSSTVGLLQGAIENITQASAWSDKELRLVPLESAANLECSNIRKG